MPNMSNEIHKQAIEIFENLTHMPQMPLKAIKYDEVLREWLKFAPKKAYDSAGTWLQNRQLFISYGDANSRNIKMEVGAPQGSVLAATLFRIHVHLLPKLLSRFNTHMFADDLAITITGSLEKRFSHNIKDIEQQADFAMKQLEKFSEDVILPVNG
ncbi:unnamed protein product [Rotaria magnacalcarata]|uniref:Reverse transcriptase domain-containing protein n=1 Tax=Rotaria magnacalcarata TaxID=392030 RepID=A0A8S2R8G9_9BILA|nr:unnamed protein product [Rotaria magnacalcarata]